MKKGFRWLPGDAHSIFLPLDQPPQADSHAVTLLIDSHPQYSHGVRLNLSDTVPPDSHAIRLDLVREGSAFETEQQTSVQLVPITADVTSDFVFDEDIQGFMDQTLATVTSDISGEFIHGLIEAVTDNLVPAFDGFHQNGRITMDVATGDVTTDILLGTGVEGDANFSSGELESGFELFHQDGRITFEPITADVVWYSFDISRHGTVAVTLENVTIEAVTESAGLLDGPLEATLEVITAAIFPVSHAGYTYNLVLEGIIPDFFFMPRIDVDIDIVTDNLARVWGGYGNLELTLARTLDEISPTVTGSAAIEIISSLPGMLEEAVFDMQIWSNAGPIYIFPDAVTPDIVGNAVTEFDMYPVLGVLSPSWTATFTHIGDSVNFDPVTEDTTSEITGEVVIWGQIASDALGTLTPDLWARQYFSTLAATTDDVVFYSRPIVAVEGPLAGTLDNCVGDVEMLSVQYVNAWVYVTPENIGGPRFAAVGHNFIGGDIEGYLFAPYNSLSSNIRGYSKIEGEIDVNFYGITIYLTHITGVTYYGDMLINTDPVQGIHVDRLWELELETADVSTHFVVAVDALSNGYIAPSTPLHDIDPYIRAYNIGYTYTSFHLTLDDVFPPPWAQNFLGRCYIAGHLVANRADDLFTDIELQTPIAIDGSVITPLRTVEVEVLGGRGVDGGIAITAEDLLADFPVLGVLGFFGYEVPPLEVTSRISLQTAIQIEVTFDAVVAGTPERELLEPYILGHSTSIVGRLDLGQVPGVESYYFDLAFLHYTIYAEVVPPELDDVYMSYVRAETYGNLVDIIPIMAPVTPVVQGWSYMEGTLAGTLHNVIRQRFEATQYGFTSVEIDIPTDDAVSAAYGYHLVYGTMFPELVGILGPMQADHLSLRYGHLWSDMSSSRLEGELAVFINGVVTSYTTAYIDLATTDYRGGVTVAMEGDVVGQRWGVMELVPADVASTLELEADVHGTADTYLRGASVIIYTIGAAGSLDAATGNLSPEIEANHDVFQGTLGIGYGAELGDVTAENVAYITATATIHPTLDDFPEALVIIAGFNSFSGNIYSDTEPRYSPLCHEPDLGLLEAIHGHPISHLDPRYWQLAGVCADITIDVPIPIIGVFHQALSRPQGFTFDVTDPQYAHFADTWPWLWFPSGIVTSGVDDGGNLTWEASGHAAIWGIMDLGGPNGSPDALSWYGFDEGLKIQGILIYPTYVDINAQVGDTLTLFSYGESNARVGSFHNFYNPLILDRTTSVFYGSGGLVWAPMHLVTEGPTPYFYMAPVSYHDTVIEATLEDSVWESNIDSVDDRNPGYAHNLLGLLSPEMTGYGYVTGSILEWLDDADLVCEGFIENVFCAIDLLTRNARTNIYAEITLDYVASWEGSFNASIAALTPDIPARTTIYAYRVAPVLEGVVPDLELKFDRPAAVWVDIYTGVPSWGGSAATTPIENMDLFLGDALVPAIEAYRWEIITGDLVITEGSIYATAEFLIAQPVSGTVAVTLENAGIAFPGYVHCWGGLDKDLIDAFYYGDAYLYEESQELIHATTYIVKGDIVDATPTPNKTKQLQLFAAANGEVIQSQVTATDSYIFTAEVSQGEYVVECDPVGTSVVAKLERVNVLPSKEVS